MGRIWTVCSGSGGTGKSMIALSLASGSAKAGKSTILLDASGISRSCDLILGLESLIVLDMNDVISQQVSIESALYPVARYDGLRFACASLDGTLPSRELSSIILALHSMCDILVIDMPTGECALGAGVMREGDERIVITRPDDASMRAVERLLLCAENDASSVSLIVNRASTERSRRRTQHTRDIVQALLDRPVLACIPEDSSIPLSEQKGRSAIECDGPAWTVLRDLLKTLLSA